MRAETREWLRFAEADFDVATSLMRRRKKLPANIVGFHCQQCVEKYLKARKEGHDIDPEGAGGYSS